MVMTPEYRTLVRHTYDLQLAVKMELVSVGAKLVSALLITPDQYQEVRNPYLSLKERAAYLIDLVQNKVQQHPRWYAVFIAAVKENKYVVCDNYYKLQVSQSEFCQGFEICGEKPLLTM